jgi:hypothetical protein
MIYRLKEEELPGLMLSHGYCQKHYLEAMAQIEEIHTQEENHNSQAIHRL